MTKKITSTRLKTIQVIRSGLNPFDITLTVAELHLKRIIESETTEAIVDPSQLYALLLFIDELNLPKTVVPLGKPPRGQTKFILTYLDGHSIILGMNLNEAGLEYFEMAPDQFKTVMDLWGSL